MTTKRTAITVGFNGAEYLELQAQAGAAGLSVPAYIVTRCGFEKWREAAAQDRKAEPRGRPVRLAMERRAVTISLNDVDAATLKAQAHEAGTRLAQYIRTLCGFAVRNTSLPGTEERDIEEEDAWERLKRLGLDPREYFPEDL